MALLLLYIVLGSMALKRARTSLAKATYLVAALLCLGYMASVCACAQSVGHLCPPGSLFGSPAAP